MSHPHTSLAVPALALLLAACATSPAVTPAPAPTPSPAPTVSSGTNYTTASRVRTLLSALSDDSMAGRMTASPGGARAARYIAEQMKLAGLEPAGDSGYFQRVPVIMRHPAPRRARGSQQPVAPDTTAPLRPYRIDSFADLDTVPAERRGMAVNVLGMLRGSDPVLRDTIVLVDAHYDHLGIGRPVNGDSIYNGADDDASGTVAVLEIARALASTGPHKRSIVFAAMTGEEVGLIGTRWYIAHPVVPLSRMAANFEIEMIARPDSLAGGPGKAWLTGYDRSTMGDMLRANGIPIVADPRPEQSFFTRSDNIAFARAGIPAHTLSTFNLHDDYHRPSDEWQKADFNHMASVINAAVRAVKLLADGPAPQWKQGGRP